VSKLYQMSSGFESRFPD